MTNAESGHAPFHQIIRSPTACELIYLQYIVKIDNKILFQPTFEFKESHSYSTQLKPNLGLDFYFLDFNYAPLLVENTRI